MSRVNAPAMLGSSARRRGVEARHQRTAITATVAASAAISRDRWARSSTCATSSSGNASSRLSPSSSANSIQMTCSSTSGTAKATSSQGSTGERMRPRVSRVSSSGT